MLRIWMLWLAVFSSPSLSRDFDTDNLEFYLHTVEVGDLIFNNFGHTAIRVVDKKNNRDLIFNWGIFDFGHPIDFSWRFYQGDLRYKLGVFGFAGSRRRYELEKRTVWQDKLLLTSQEKGILWRRLVWNARPENREYDYQYFFDNCSTRPRDYIDEALGGIIQQNLSKKFTEETFRDMVRQHYATNSFVAMSLDILMNSRLDRPMSYWEKMFLPKALRSLLLEQYRSDGSRILGQSEVLFEFPRPEPFLFQPCKAMLYFWFVCSGIPQS